MAALKLKMCPWQRNQLRVTSPKICNNTDNTNSYFEITGVMETAGYSIDNTGELY